MMYTRCITCERDVVGNKLRQTTEQLCGKWTSSVCFLTAHLTDRKTEKMMVIIHLNIKMFHANLLP